MKWRCFRNDGRLRSGGDNLKLRDWVLLLQGRWVLISAAAGEGINSPGNEEGEGKIGRGKKEEEGEQKKRKKKSFLPSSVAKKRLK